MVQDRHEALADGHWGRFTRFHPVVRERAEVAIEVL
jgi:hypothetical protein